MKINFYGRLAETIGPEIDCAFSPGMSVGEARRLLETKHPLAAATLANGRTIVCIAGSIVGDDHVITGEDVLEFLPPVSGG